MAKKNEKSSKPESGDVEIMHSRRLLLCDLGIF